MMAIHIDYEAYKQLLKFKTANVFFTKSTRLDFDIEYNIIYLIPTHNNAIIPIERFKLIGIHSRQEHLKQGFYKATIALIE